jgi:SHS2 domain-containing protein
MPVEDRTASDGAGASGGPCWEHFSHAADVGIRGWGHTPAEAFAHAALALTAVVTDPAKVKLSETLEIDCTAATLDVLLFRWLNAVVFQMATRNLLLGAFDVAIDNGRLKARAYGESVVRERHAPAVEVKGATFTELKVEQCADGRWLAQCVLDV